MIRIESTYLIKKLPSDLSKLRKAKIEQGYLVDSEDAIRLRKKDDNFTISRKLMPMVGDTSYREQHEVPISEEEFNILWKSIKKSLSKTRYYYKSTPGYEIRIDVFERKLKYLYLAEVLFFDESSNNNFETPEWFGREVTGEDWASNQFLASTNYGAIADRIK